VVWRFFCLIAFHFIIIIIVIDEFLHATAPRLDSRRRLGFGPPCAGYRRLVEKNPPPPHRAATAKSSVEEFARECDRRFGDGAAAGANRDGHARRPPHPHPPPHSRSSEAVTESVRKECKNKSAVPPPINTSASLRARFAAERVAREVQEDNDVRRSAEWEGERFNRAAQGDADQQSPKRKSLAGPRTPSPTQRSQKHPKVYHKTIAPRRFVTDKLCAPCDTCVCVSPYVPSHLLCKFLHCCLTGCEISHFFPC